MEKEMRIGWLAGPATAAAIVMLAACGSSGGGGTNTSAPAGGSGGSSASSAPAASGSSSVIVKVKKTGAGTFLTNAAGFTLYTFQADKGTTSTCYDACAQFWPPVLGTAHLAAGQNISGHFGTTTRKDGKTQVTYDGHPLYTYAGDTQPGQTSGNGINQSGGIWNVVTTSASGGAGAGAGSSPSSAPSSGSGGGGYGY
jgi:predicted lipoprotein with Yx(FWY)xxD motif